MGDFIVAVPVSGYSGWRFLERTAERQKQTFESSPQIRRDLEYFRTNIAKATTAEALVADRGLLKVALGAFGLDDDIDKKAYVLKVLAEGTESDKAFANRIVDKRYRAMAEAFGYGNLGGANSAKPGFAHNIAERYKTRQFEVAIGEADPSMRLAMGLSRQLPELLNSSASDSSVWFQILGNPPLRTVFETAYGLPRSFGSLDVDKQRDILRARTDRFLGDSSAQVFGDPANIEKLLQRYFLRKQLAEGPAAGVPGSAALSLLTNAAGSMAGLFQSRLL